MKLTSKNFAASAATAITFAFLAMAPSAQAADFCIINGAQTAHGCGYPTMEACRAATAGIGGSCTEGASPAAKNPSDAMAYHQTTSHSRAHHHVKKPVEN